MLHQPWGSAHYFANCVHLVLLAQVKQHWTAINRFKFMLNSDDTQLSKPTNQLYTFWNSLTKGKTQKLRLDRFNMCTAVQDFRRQHGSFSSQRKWIWELLRQRMQNPYLFCILTIMFSRKFYCDAMDIPNKITCCAGIWTLLCEVQAYIKQ